MDEKQLYYEKGNKLNDVLKRTMDVILSLAGLVIISPLLFIISICIKLDSRGPVFFKQTRVGRYEEPFQIFKFRTMIVDAEKKGNKLLLAKIPGSPKQGNFFGNISWTNFRSSSMF